MRSKMNTFFKTIFASLIAFVLFSVSALACEIEFKVLKGEKDTYSKGDELIVKVEVFFTHKNCPEGISTTKFQPNGFKILQGTKWRESSTGQFERKLKIKVTKSGAGKAVLKAVRTCDKEGGLGSFEVKTK